MNSRALPYLSFFFAVFLASCQQEDSLTPNASVKDQTFTHNLRVDGHAHDNMVMENCTFVGATLSIGNADNITIKNCTFKNIKHNGLMVGFIGPSSNITIDNCSFENIGYNAIDSHDDAFDCTIKNCQFKQVARSGIGGAMGQAHHCIYWKGPDVEIANSNFDCTDQPYGNGISVRSSGYIHGNTIHSSLKNGIMYYADHPGGDSLLIENNFLYDNAFSFSMASADITEYHNSTVIFRFNSCQQENNYSINVGAQFEGTTQVEVYGNLIVNSLEKYFNTPWTIANMNFNSTHTPDPGFVDLNNGNLHLEAGSSIQGTATGLTEFPEVDIDNDLRDISSLTPGADEL